MPASAARNRALLVLTVPRPSQVEPLSVEYHQVPLLVSAPVIAMPSWAPASGSVTLLSPPPPAKSTRLDTSVPTAPKGAPTSSFTGARTGLAAGLSTGAVLPMIAVRFRLNSDVLPDKSVAVAVMTAPAGTEAPKNEALKLALPKESVVTFVEPR